MSRNSSPIPVNGIRKIDPMSLLRKIRKDVTGSKSQIVINIINPYMENQQTEKILTHEVDELNKENLKIRLYLKQLN